MAFLRTFTALLVAAAIWMVAFVGFGESNSPVLKTLADWLSPLTVLGWLFYVVLCVGCFLLAWRVMGRSPTAEREGNGK